MSAYYENGYVVSRDLAVSNFSSVNSSAILDLSERHTIQVMATVTSTVSLAFALLAIYWFILMRRNFRRDLILLLIVGGGWKSLWFLVFSAFTFANGPVETGMVFCQLSGYFSQIGFVACDLAVLLMSMHMYYQIFPPSHSILGHDGLYRVRYWIYGAWLIFPNISASLAFINPRAAYRAQGGFCTMPIRPLWYRLALYWIPRYMIWAYVTFVAVKIYRYVGSEFKVFGKERPSDTSLNMPGESSIDRAAARDLERTMQERLQTRSMSYTEQEATDADEEIAPDDVSKTLKIKPMLGPVDETAAALAHNPINRQSTANWTLPFTPDLRMSTTQQHSRRGSQQIAAGVFASDFSSPDFAPPPPIPSRSEHRPSITSMLSSTRSITKPILTETSQKSPANDPPTATTALKLRRLAIQRQLRLLFIYPCIYLLLWTLPLVVNVMNYTTHYAQHPVFALSFLQVLSLTLMTTIDVLVFCWRERPWRHIAGADGTVMGSLCFWRFCRAHDGRENSTTPPSGSPSTATASEKPTEADIPSANQKKPWLKTLLALLHRRASTSTSTSTSTSSTLRPHKRTFSGRSDKQHLEAERAHERLRLERAECEARKKCWDGRRVSVVSVLDGTLGSRGLAGEKKGMGMGPGRREWFDGFDGFDGLGEDEEGDMEIGEKERRGVGLNTCV